MTPKQRKKKKPRRTYALGLEEGLNRGLQLIVAMETQAYPLRPMQTFNIDVDNIRLLVHNMSTKPAYIGQFGTVIVIRPGVEKR